MSINFDIQIALDKQLSQLTGAIDIAWMNTQYTPKNNRVFIRPTLLPALTTTAELDSTNLYKGIYQIDVFVPADSGMQILLSMLDSVDDLFKSTKTLIQNNTTVFIQQTGRGVSQRQEAWFTSYIQVDYFSYSK